MKYIRLRRSVTDSQEGTQNFMLSFTHSLTHMNNTCSCQAGIPVHNGLPGYKQSTCTRIIMQFTVLKEDRNFQELANY